MYSILLVDDESSVRRSIISRTPWEKYGFKIIGEADNGIEALEKIEELSPDVLITDIRMPYLDGMSLIERVRELRPTTTIIILSGYDEFTFAQNAIRYKVQEYVLKPVSRQDIIELLIKTKEKLDTQIQELNDKEALSKAYDKALPLLKENFLVSLITSSIPLEKDFVETSLKEFGYNEKNDIFIVCSLESDISLDSITLFSIFQLVNKVLKDENLDTKTLQLDNKIIIIYSDFSHGKLDDYHSLFYKKVERSNKNILAFIHRYLQKEVTIGVSEITDSPLKLKNSYNQSLKALNYKPYYPEQDILYHKDLEQQDFTISNEKDLHLLDTKFQTAVKLGSNEEVIKYASQYFEKDCGIEPEKLQSYFLVLLSKLADLTLKHGSSLAQMSNENSIDFFKELSTINTIQSAKTFYISISLQVHELVKDQREISHVKFVEQAKIYIADNYQDPTFCLDSICDSLGVSLAYFSTTFKKETGKSFVRSLTEMRIEKSKVYLEQTDKKTYEIASLVGFNDANYFSFTFKRTTGISPSVFRSKTRNK